MPLCPTPSRLPSGFLTQCVCMLAMLGTTAALGVDENYSNRETPIVRAVKRTRPSVVNINGRKTIRDDDAPYGSRDRFRKVNGMGTGVIIDERGYIVTNFHVVEGVATIRVTLADKTMTTARLVAHDPRTDLAVIKIETSKPLPVIPCGTSSDLMLGETVIAIGNAYGYKDSITRGIISEVNRTVEVSDEQTYYNLIQTDAAINPGNSGGPLINIDGEMIGINVAVRMGAQSIGFTIPVNPAMEIVAGLIKKENRENVKLPIVAATDFKLDDPRLIVRDSTDGLEVYEGDEITSIDGKRVSKALDLERALIGKTSEDVVSLQVRRGTKTLQIESPLVSSQTAPDKSSNTLEAKVWNRFGFKLKEIPSTQFKRITSKYRGGLLVDQVRSGSQANSQNIQPGDVLLGIHEWETTTLGHIAYIIEQNGVYSGSPIEFFVFRNGEVLKGNFRLAMRNQQAIQQ